MNQKIREALRSKHQVCQCSYCSNDECAAGCLGIWPCDTIMVLDALEKVLNHGREL